MSIWFFAYISKNPSLCLCLLQPGHNLHSCPGPLIPISHPPTSHTHTTVRCCAASLGTLKLEMQLLCLAKRFQLSFQTGQQLSKMLNWKMLNKWILPSFCLQTSPHPLSPASMPYKSKLRALLAQQSRVNCHTIAFPHQDSLMLSQFKQKVKPCQSLLLCPMTSSIKRNGFGSGQHNTALSVTMATTAL